MIDDLVERLRADELPGDSQNKREARMELGKILDEAADRIETLEKENTKLREEKLNLKVAAEKALRYSSDSDDWNKYGEGYGDLRKWVQKIARDTENG